MIGFAELDKARKQGRRTNKIIDDLESDLAVAVTILGDIKIYLDASRVEQTPTGYDINGDNMIRWIQDALEKIKGE